MTFDEWDKGIKNGTITETQPNRRKKILAEAKKHDEPLQSLIIGTLGGYRGNLINDLKRMIKDHGGQAKFREMYKNAGAEFKSEMEKLIGKKPVTSQDFKDLFEGFEAHHVIPANFLRNNPTVQKLLKQPGIEFGYNYLDNLIFIPSDNHTKGKQRGHPDYDKEIGSRIDKRVKPLVDKQQYKAALAELKKIVKEVKTKFINEIIGSNKNAMDI
jgi:hypothetical protein